MRSVWLVILLATTAWAITPEEQATIVQCYQIDAAVRGKDDRGMVAELLNFIFLSRNQQKNQLANTMQRCRDRITTQQTNFDTDKAASQAALTQQGTEADAAISAVPTLP